MFQTMRILLIALLTITLLASCSSDKEEEIHVARSLRSRHIICFELSRKSHVYGI